MDHYEAGEAMKKCKRASDFEEKAACLLKAIEDDDYAPIDDLLQAGFNPNEFILSHTLHLSGTKNDECNNNVNDLSKTASDSNHHAESLCLPITTEGMAKKRKKSGSQPATNLKRCKIFSLVEKKAEDLLIAIENGDVPANEFLEAGFDPSDFIISTVHFSAVKNDEFATVTDLKKTRLDQNHLPSTKSNCSSIATGKNTVNIKYRKKPHESPLSIAVAKGDYDTVAFLINRGTNLHNRDLAGNCIRHLHLISAVNSFGEILRKSPLESVDLPNVADKTKNKIQQELLETEFRYFLTLKFLLEADSSRLNEPCCSSVTILCSWITYAQMYTRQVTTFVKLLLKFGADVNIPTVGKTPLFLSFYPALQSTHRLDRNEIPKLLLMHGARFDARVSANTQRNILHCLIQKNKVKELKLIFSFVNIDVNSRKYYYHGLPLLHYAFHHDKPAIVRLLLTAGADVFKRDLNNHSLYWILSQQIEHFRDRELKCLKFVMFYLVVAVRLKKHELTPEENYFISHFLDVAVYWNSFYHSVDMTEPISKPFPVSILQLFSASEEKLLEIGKKYVPKNFHTIPGFGKRFKQFDCYDLIKEKLGKARERRDLLREKQIIKKLGSFLFPSRSLDRKCVETIIESLSTVDLRNLIRAAKIGISEL